MFDSAWWMLMTVLGPVVIGGAIAYALLTRRRLTPREKMDQHEAVEEVYDGGEGGPGAPHAPSRRSSSG